MPASTLRTYPRAEKHLAHADWKADEAVLVIAHNLANPEESVAWVRSQPYPYIIMQQGQRGPNRVAKAERLNSLRSDHGGAAASYLQFILEHYDNLPAVMIFNSATPYFAGLVGPQSEPRVVLDCWRFYICMQRLDLMT